MSTTYIAWLVTYLLSSLFVVCVPLTQLVFDLTSVGRDRGVYIPLNSRLFLQDDIDYFGYFIYQYKLDLFI